MSLLYNVVIAVSATPDATGLPGGAALQRFVNGGVFLGLLLCVASVVGGGATWAISNGSHNSHYAQYGRKFVMGGIAGAFFIGGAAALVNFFFNAGVGIA